MEPLALIAIVLVILVISLIIHFFQFIVAVVAICLALMAIVWIGIGIRALYQKGWKKTIKITFGLIVAVPICLFGFAYSVTIWEKYQYEHSIEGIIKTNETTLKDLGRHLEWQISLISDIENTNKNDIQVFLKEIEEEKEKYQIRNLSSATLRVRNNLQLIRERDANLSQLSQIKRATQNGLEETIFMLRQLDGAKGMAKVMTDGKVLAASSERILKQYGPYQKAIVINPKHRDFKSTEEIWRVYVVKSGSPGVTSLMPN